MVGELRGHNNHMGNGCQETETPLIRLQSVAVAAKLQLWPIPSAGNGKRIIARMSPNCIERCGSKKEYTLRNGFNSVISAGSIGYQNNPIT